jgi:hypothetical protein
VTTVYAALEHRFTLRCDHPWLRRHLAAVHAALAVRPADAADRTAAGCYDLRVRGGPPYVLTYRGEVVVSSHEPAAPYAHLLHHVNRSAIEVSGRRRTILHAAAVAGAGGAILLPARSGRGKSTLVAGLARRGWAYVTDELVAVHADAQQVEAYPRSISLDDGAWRLFPDLAPDIPSEAARFVPHQWQVAPDTLGRVVNDAVMPAAVVLHRHEPGTASTLREHEPVEVLRDLLGCSLTLATHTERDLRTLAALVDRSPCFELVVGELDAACWLLEQRFGPPARVGPSASRT